MAEETGLTKKTDGGEEISDESLYKEIGADETPDETEQIREQIEETRHKMGDTIDAIQERLSFENISEQVSEQVSEQALNIYETAKDSVYDATIGKAGKFMNNLNRELKNSTVINKVGGNPFPLFLIALGAGLLIFNNGRRKNRHSAGFRENRQLYSGSESDAENKSSMLKNAKDTVTGAAGSAYETAGDAANSAYEGVGNVANSAYQGVTNLASGTLRKVEDLGSQAQNQYEHYINENPLAVGALAFAVGATVGLAIPSTEYENEIAGEARQQLMSKVKGSVNETVDRVKNVAGEAKNTLGEEAKNQGLI